MKKRTKIEEILEILSDLEWHCRKCDIPSAQPARPLKTIKDMGYSFVKNESKTHDCVSKFCEKCNERTPHSKLVSTEKINSPVERVKFTQKIRNRIKTLYDNRDAFNLTSYKSGQLEIDHRVTPDRTGGEKPLPKDVSDNELKERYMLLTRENNQKKRESCKKCISSNIRQISFGGINFFYEGSEKYEGTCVGCYWAYPNIWRNKLNERITKNG